MDNGNSKRKRQGNTSQIPKKVRIGPTTTYSSTPSDILYNHQILLDEPVVSDNEQEDLELRQKRNAVKTQGYESDDSVHDSDEEEEESIKGEEEEDDMFGESFSKQASDKKKSLSSNEIEGQEWNADVGDFTDDGVRIEPFNMDQELQEGSFDQQGHFIRKRDEMQMHDSWLQGVTSVDIQKAKDAHEKQLLKERQESLKQESALLDVNQVWKRILELMNPKETLVAAIKRWGGNQKIEPKWKQKKIKTTTTPSLSSAELIQIEKNKKVVEELTSLSDQLMAQGHFEVFQVTYEQIKDKLPSSLPTEKDLQDSNKAKWEFKWEHHASSQVYGPYTSQEMIAWKEQGYFDQHETLPWIKNVNQTSFTQYSFDFGFN